MSCVCTAESESEKKENKNKKVYPKGKKEEPTEDHHFSGRYMVLRGEVEHCWSGVKKNRKKE